MADTESIPNVFPGLRPFEPEEAYLFFGREGQTDELVRRLARNRFLAVVGTSGSGKSSLVRAGLLPYLRSGFLSEAGASWRIALLRPGLNPIASLARALNSSAVLGIDDLDPMIRFHHLETTLRRSSFGLIEAVRLAQLDPRQNLLVVVDQFEEIFRLRDVRVDASGRDEESAAFVKLLLEASHQAELPIYVVITMRSDFIGDCAEFRDLPESLNRSQYLIPRMTRDQLQEAIEGPIAVGGATITSRLVQRLLNDVGDDLDHLPVLQHALMRTWETWSETQPRSAPVDLQQYVQIGGMATALSRHADEAFNELDERGREIARKMFQRLSEIGKDNRESRRPTKLSELAALVEADETTVIAIVDCFRTRGRSFLAPYAGQPLNADSVIEISHESLIRLWTRLHEWAEDEAESATLYGRLVDAAVRHAGGGAALWRDPELQFAIDWKERSRPNEVWTERYGGEFKTAMRFLELSQVDARYRDRLRHLGTFASILAAVVFAGISIFAFVEMREARRLSVQSFARQLASQSELLEEQDPGQIEVASLLAVESVRRASLIETTTSLYKLLRALPAASFVYPGAPDPKTRVYAAVSADGRLAVRAVGDDVRVLEASSGRQVQSLTFGSIRSLALSPEGKYLAVARDYSVAVVEVASAKKLWQLDVVWPFSVIIGPNAKYVAISFESHVEVIRLEDAAVLIDLPRRELADGTNTGKTAPAPPQEGPRLKQNPRLAHNGYHAIGFSADGNLFAAAGQNVDNAVYDLQLRQRVYELPARRVTALTFSPGNDVLVTAGDGIDVFEQASGTMRQRISSSTPIRAVAISPRGRYIAAAGPETIELFDVSAGKSSVSLATKDQARSIAFDKQGTSLLAINDNRLMTFGPVDEHVIPLAGASELGPVAISPSGRFIALAMMLPRSVVCRIIDLVTGKETSNQQLSSKSIRGLAISTEGKHLAVIPNAYGRIPIIDTVTGGQEPDYLASGNYSALAFSRNGFYIAAALRASGSRESEILIGHRMEASLVRPQLPGFAVRLLTFSPDGEYLAAAGEKSIAVYATTGREIARFEAPADLRAITLSSNANYLAAAGRRIIVYNVTTGEQVISYPIEAEQLGAMGLGDNRQLTVAWQGTDGIVTAQYPGEPDTLVEEVCHRLVRNLTSLEWRQYFGAENYRRTCPGLP